MSFTSRTFKDGDTFTGAHANEIKNEISELYSNQSDYIKLVQWTSGSTVTVPAHSSLRVTEIDDYTAPTIPNGYKLLFSVTLTSGDARVIGAGFNNYWVANTCDIDLNVTLSQIFVCIRDA